jgi:hypothetical protein
MKTIDKLTLQALKLKELNTEGHTGGGDLIGQFLEQDDVKEKMKNLCAYISPALFDEVSNIGDLLNLSKRQIVEMAVIDFVAQAWEVINQTGALETPAPPTADQFLVKE